MTGSDGAASRALTLTFGHDELVIRRRYETLSIVNDILIGIWFAVGSVLFFSASTTYAGTWLFVVGSVELLIRPGIRLARAVHLKRLPSHQPGAPTDDSQDH